MAKVIVFLLSVLMSLSPLFSRAGSNEGVFLSFEHYKMQDGWTPVVLSMGELNCLLWMDETGKVSELREPGAHHVEPLCVIDAPNQSLRRETNALYFEVYEQNNVRTRWRLSPGGGTAGTVTNKILFREKKGIDLCLGNLRLPLKHVAWDLKEISPGLYNVQFHGPMMKGRRPLVYEKAVGRIYSTHEWDKRLIPGQSRTQTVNPGKTTSGGIPPRERAALIALYNSTDGDHWYNNWGWKTPPLAADGFALPGTEDDWYGIATNIYNTSVGSIYTYENNLNGALPPELGNLDNLAYLLLDSNQLSGSIPPELGNLDNLLYLYLFSNQLSGSIPPELGNLVKLQELYLFSNQLSGSIPPELGNMANLQGLGLWNNQLSGNIPPELGNLVNMDCCDLSLNRLSGSIPPQLGNLNNLLALWLNSNRLSGSIPPELGNLVKMDSFDLSFNMLSGSIPPQLGNLVNVYWFNLSLNLLNGSIPPQLGNLAKVPYLWLYLNSNRLSGIIPPELGNLTNLVSLELNGNQLSGSIPPELVNMAKLESLKLNGNHLSGSIPPELGNMVNLYYLYLNSNQLSGSIPPELGNMTNLRTLWLHSNRLSGNIPSNLTNLTNLWIDWLDLKWNALYTKDDLLMAFLDSKQYGGNWENTQTIVPLNVTATAVSISSIDIHWTPITYTSDTGGYRVFYSTTPGGPYTYFGMTANKSASSLTVTGLNPDSTYYFVVQTRTHPHGNNPNTVDSEYSAEVSAITPQFNLTSPTGGESWVPGTIRNITWTSLRLSGNIQLELWKANKKFSIIAANIPIVNGNYAWTIGNNAVGPIPAGNDYKIKIITANGLNNDFSNSTFSILQPSLTLTAPRGGENWKLGTQQDITWTSVGLTGNVRLLLFKDGVRVGVIARGIPIANGTYAWTVGKHSMGVAPTGSNYTVKIRSEDNQPYNSGSGAFTLQ